LLEDDVLVGFEAGLVDFEVVEEVDELASVGVEVAEGVDEDDLVLGHGDAVLDVARELLVDDHEHDDPEALGGEVHQVEDGLVLQLFQPPDLQDDQALAFTHSPHRETLPQLLLELLGLEPEVVVVEELPLQIFKLVLEVLEQTFLGEGSEHQFYLFSSIFASSEYIGFGAEDVIVEILERF
jgi:hypothetical protein